jgi:glutamyl-tRNA synthetase
MHLPLLRNADKSKISKRKNPTSLTWFMARGYAREALVNFLGLMGYSFGDDREIFNFEELTKAYDASRISTTAPIFDFAKLDRFNATYVQEFSPERFQGYQQEAQQALLDYVEPLRPHLQQRVKSVFDLGRWTRFLFEREPQYRSEAFKIKKMDQAKASNTLKSLAKAFGKKRPQNMEQFKSCVYEVCQDISVPMGSACMLLRVGVMEEQESLPLFEVCEFLGSDLAIKKIKDADKFIKSGWPSPKK